MSDEQINIAIEEIIRPALHGNIYRPTRDYCNDLNAMQEAEKMLNSEQWVAYGKELSRLGVFPMVHANAKERTEAFLRTFGKWKETK
jgi:hypothetical protein